MNIDKYYKTSDFNTAVILLTLGNHVVQKERQGGQVTFYFENTDEVKNILYTRMMGQIKLNPDRIFSSERLLRGLIKETIINY